MALFNSETYDQNLSRLRALTGFYEGVHCNANTAFIMGLYDKHQLNIQKN
jgi:hypothetical protein